VDKYLGVASFIYILNILKKDFYMGNDRSVSVSPIKPGTPQIFSFNKIQGMDCGFIHTNIMMLKNVFNDNELSTVLGFCERKHDNIIKHCSVSGNITLKNNILTDKDGRVFNCYTLNKIA
jgi:hypothetical protein